jgi:hypothetical protein
VLSLAACLRHLLFRAALPPAASEERSFIRVQERGDPERNLVLGPSNLVRASTPALPPCPSSEQDSQMNPRMLATEIEDQSSLLFNQFLPGHIRDRGRGLAFATPSQRGNAIRRLQVRVWGTCSWRALVARGSILGQEQQNNAKPSARISFQNNSSQTRPKTRDP